MSIHPGWDTNSLWGTKPSYSEIQTVACTCQFVERKCCLFSSVAISTTQQFGDIDPETRAWLLRMVENNTKAGSLSPVQKGV